MTNKEEEIAPAPAAAPAPALATAPAADKAPTAAPDAVKPPAAAPAAAKDPDAAKAPTAAPDAATAPAATPDAAAAAAAAPDAAAATATASTAASAKDPVTAPAAAAVPPPPPDKNLFRAFIRAAYVMVDAPVTCFRELVVVPNQKKYPWYHRRYRRVPTINECYDDDVLCDFEADSQFKRDRLVDSEILLILRQRYEDCMMYENPDHLRMCKPLLDVYKKTEEAWFVKYGDLGAYSTARKAYMKQKHRQIWERRHGFLSDQSTSAD